ncbi:MAG: hypothetical protein ACRD38_01300 [Nitrososphaerales archaeon]
MSDNPVESREEEILSGTITETNKAKDTKKIFQVVEGIVRKDTFTRVSFASCGHLLHSSQDVGGKCTIENCSNIPCAGCFRLCARCQKGLCNRHQKLWKGFAFCGSCHWKILLIGWRGDGSRAN